MSEHDLDFVAQQIFTAALREDRAGELLKALFDGGSATVDRNNNLVLVDGFALEGLR